MVKNNDVVFNFVNDCENIRTENLFFENDVLYSYGYHFPLCIKLLDNTFLINKNGYSNTTARHKGLLCRNLNFSNFKDLEQNNNQNTIKLFSTDELKSILDNGFKTLSQITENKI